MHRRVMVLLFLALLGGCGKNETQKCLTIDNARIERGEGVSLSGAGGAQIGHSVMVVGTLTKRIRRRRRSTSTSR